MKVIHFITGAMLIALAVEPKTEWTAALAAGANVTPPAYLIRRIPFGAVHHQQTGSPRLRLWESTSGNWSGYAVPKEGTTADTFSKVQGSWSVPSVTGGRSASYSSTWVGLDGYETATVEQIGTEQDWTGRAQQNYAWFEMYPSGAYELNPALFPVEPGDTISATVSYAGETTVAVGRNRTEEESVFQLNIASSRGWTFAVPTSYTTVTSAARGSAEWVAEAPSSRNILPLADFGAVSFSNCEAASVLSGGALSPIDGTWTPDPLTMVDPEGGGAAPSALSANGEGFTVTWAAN